MNPLWILGIAGALLVGWSTRNQGGAPLHPKALAPAVAKLKARGKALKSATVGDRLGGLQLVSRNGATLTPEAMAGLECAIGKVGPFLIVSSYRTRTEQEALYQRYLAGKGPRAAPPGLSYHEKGLAIDLGADSPQVKAALRACGWHQFDPVGEWWHFSYGVTG